MTDSENYTDVTENSEDTLSILVASDIHLGYAEKDAIRGEDSFITFEEILSLAESKNVDLILLGGDLFHDNKPTPKCIHRCMSLIRKYCMGDKPVPVEFLSNQEENFKHCTNPVVNYEDPNLNISIPIFSIHGNHDDPSGYGRVSSLDLLSTSGLVNYFGKWTDLNSVEISPLLMRKGETKIALYGLSYIKDERLARLFRDCKVKMFRPREEPESWFNIFMLHQNRVNRGPNNYIAEEMLPAFLDFIIWGHEHECRIVPEKNAARGFHVIQPGSVPLVFNVISKGAMNTNIEKIETWIKMLPGSPVATSLCEGEAVQKHVAILKIYKKKFKVKPIKLNTVRPFVFDTLVLSECRINTTKSKPSDEVQKYLTNQMETLLLRAKSQISGDRRQPMEPLIRLRVEYSNENEMFNGVRFGLKYADHIANPTELLLFRKHRSGEKSEKDGTKLDRGAMDAILRNQDDTQIDKMRVEQVVERYFTEVDPNKHLKVLSIKGMAEAATRFVDVGDKDALPDLVDHQMKRVIDYLVHQKVALDNLDEELENFRLHRLQNAESEAQEDKKMLGDPSRGQLSQNKIKGFDSDSDIEELKETTEFDSSSVRGRGGRARASRGNRGSRGPRGVKGNSISRGRGRKEPVMQPKITDVISQQSSSTRSSRTTTNKTHAKMMYISDTDEEF